MPFYIVQSVLTSLMSFGSQCLVTFNHSSTKPSLNHTVTVICQNDHDVSLNLLVPHLAYMLYMLCYINLCFHFNLYIYIGKVSKPTISCDMNNGSSDTSGAQATLTCAAEPTHPLSLMKYEWESSGNVSPGHELTIFLEDEHDDKIYSCMVSNPLTNDTATFTPKNCYSGKISLLTLLYV